MVNYFGSILPSTGLASVSEVSGGEKHTLGRGVGARRCVDGTVKRKQQPMYLRATSNAGACHQLQCDEDCFLALLDFAEGHGWRPTGTFTPLLNLRPDPA